MFLEPSIGERPDPLPLYETDDLPPDTEAKKNKTVIDDGVRDLLHRGMNFFEKLSNTLSNPEKTTLLVNSMVETDHKIGK